MKMKNDEEIVILVGVGGGVYIWINRELLKNLYENGTNFAIFIL